MFTERFLKTLIIKERNKMKKLILLLLFIPLVSFSQKLNNNSDGYTEIIEVELTKKEIHQKLTEWIALNYKSANDVIQLNTEDKIVLKGNYIFNSPLSGAYGIRNTTTFSIKDNKFKIDLIPTSAFNKSTMKDTNYIFISQYFENDIQTFEEFKPWHRANTIKIWLNQGYSEKRTKKLAEKHLTTEYQKKLFNDRLKAFENWNSSISSTFKSIKDYVSQSADDW